MKSTSSLKDVLNDWLGEGTGFRAVAFEFPVTPLPTPRHRTTRDGQTYYAPSYVGWRGDVAPHIPQMHPLIEGKVAIAVEHVCPPYKTVDREYPKGDVDNYVKGVFDVITKSKRIWTDDIQVTHCITMKRFVRDGEVPHTTIYIREV